MPRITAVDDHLGTSDELTDDSELPLIVLNRNRLDAKALRNHRQGSQTPCLPPWSIVVRFLQSTEVPKRPRHSIAIPFVVADSFVYPAGRGSEDVGDVTSHAGLFGDADDQDSRYEG